MAGKWFAETSFDAAQWGRRFYQWSGTSFYVIGVDVPESVTGQPHKKDEVGWGKVKQVGTPQ